ncbi:biosynthetic-type acetolactate synthase large subunit [Fodinisporobacter ferrooxydans]|uniref:Acetolactate synthase n=1 Tax=Fodinisporobacter ferrooxydans TaxID=2901836 RepID=A0ABY4CPZ7_9BACL|nr:biosynthetic-type acetolactate synthase large subunit [Alicyclobacillaceae bacterium MYW30-H2]
MLAEQQQATKLRSGAEILLDCLLDEQVETLFGYPGGAVLPIYDALYHYPQIRHILTRHEQAAVHAADGFARVTGKTGVVLVTSGPGATNTVTGIANAYMDSVPLVIITGQVPENMIGRDSFQEVDIYGITMPITKHNYLINDVNELATVVKEAFYIANSGRKGPVLIDIPKNIMTAQTDAEIPEQVKIRGYRGKPPVSQRMVERMAARIQHARKPVFLIGGGVIGANASEIFRQLVEQTQIPVVSTMMGIGAFPTRHPLFLGMLGMHGTFAANKAVHQADLLIALGVRFSDRVMGKAKSFSPESYKIHVDVDASELNKNIKIDLPITADIQDVLLALQKYPLHVDTDEWVELTTHWQKKVPRFDRSNSQLKPQSVIQLLDAATEGNGIVVTDVGQHQIWTIHNYAFAEPRSLLTSAGLGTMGYGLPAAIGAAFAAPNRQVICISGDGSFQMNLQELMTVVDHQLPIKIAILNNGYLGMVRQWQELFFENRYSSVKISSPDFVTLAKSYGITGLRAHSYEQAKAIIQTAMSIDGPVLMEFDVAEEENVYPMVPPGGENHEMILPE